MARKKHNELTANEFCQDYFYHHHCLESVFKLDKTYGGKSVRLTLLNNFYLHVALFGGTNWHCTVKEVVRFNLYSMERFAGKLEHSYWVYPGDVESCQRLLGAVRHLRQELVLDKYWLRGAPILALMSEAVEAAANPLQCWTIIRQDEE